MNTVYIMRGISGAGKSTYARANWPGAIIVSADDHFVRGGKYVFNPSELPAAHQGCFRRFLAALGEGAAAVVVDNTNMNAWEISPYVLAAESYGRVVEIVEVRCPVVVSLARGTHGVPAHALAAMAKRMEREELPPWWSVRVVSTA